MRRAKAFSTVNWRKYLDVNTNPRADNFLKAKGDDVLWQIAANIHQTTVSNSDELVLLVHPNAGAVIKINKKEYKEVLNLCLDWFVNKEDYGKCSQIKKIMIDLEKINTINKKQRKIKETLI
jgi:hypothetical protein